MAGSKSGGQTSDDAVRRATGRGWDEWFRLLDAQDAAELKHKAIVERLCDRHGVPGWWAQSITVEYERARGLRLKYQKSDGSFSVSATKTVAVPVGRLFAMWSDTELRSEWLPNAPIQIRKATADQSMRFTWNRGPSKVDVDFSAKSEAKSQVAVSHEKLPDFTATEAMRAHWREALERLKAKCEGKPASGRTRSRRTTRADKGGSN